MQPCTKMIQVLIKYLFYYKSYHHIELKLGLNWSFLLNSWIGLVVKMAFEDAPLHATFKISHLIKGTSYRKLFFCHMIALNVSWMDFIWQKTKILFSRYLIFCTFDESTNVKNLWRHSRHYCISAVILFWLFL